MDSQKDKFCTMVSHRHKERNPIPCIQLIRTLTYPLVTTVASRMGHGRREATMQCITGGYENESKYLIKNMHCTGATRHLPFQTLSLVWWLQLQFEDY